VIRHLLQETTIPAVPEGVSLSELYDFSRLHGVEAMVFHGLERLDMDKADLVWQNWCNRADMLLTQSIVQLAERDILFSALSDAGIPILPVKGCWLKEQYPDIDYRQMSDLDMLIHPEHLKQAEAVMTRMGYEKESNAAENHDAYKKPPYMGVELHHALLPEDDTRISYYEDVWQRAEPEEAFPGVFRLKPEDEYIYYILHLFKHVLIAGTGIRSFLDRVMYRKIYPDMDWDYLEAEFEKLQITEFADSVKILSDCWFDTGATPPEHMKTMAQSILGAGTYGSQTLRVHGEIQQFREKSRNPRMMKIAYGLYMIFPPMRLMKERYPVLRKAPFLLPVFWLWRLVSRLLFRWDILIGFLKRTNEEGDKTWSEFNWQKFQSK
jgi:hypothetical protein